MLLITSYQVSNYEEVYKVVEILEEIAQDHLYEQYSTKRGLVV